MNTETERGLEIGIHARKAYLTVAQQIGKGVPAGSILRIIEKSSPDFGKEELLKFKAVSLIGAAAVATEDQLTGHRHIIKACKQSLNRDLGVPFKAAGVLLDLGAEKGSGEKFEETLNEVLANLAQNKKPVKK